MAGLFFSNIPRHPAIWIWHGVGLPDSVRLRTQIARAVAGLAICSTAALAVGITAPTDGVFSIAVRPVFMRIDPAALAESRARALGVDIDVKVGAMHMHLGWSAISLSPITTNTPSDLF
jgi:hypothetical protein